MGEITESKLQKENNKINQFAGQCRKMYAFLDVSIIDQNNE
jgi:hypothetical protein